MSRVSRRAGTKALVCPECNIKTKTKSGRNILSFRGKGAHRLARHRFEVHGVKA